MDVESLAAGTKYTAMTPPMHTNRRRRNLCFISISIFLFFVLIFIILAFTIFKAKQPVITVNSVILRDLDLSLDIARLRVNLNITLQADLDVDNPNHVGFKYDATSALLQYDGVVVGDAPIPAGEIGSRQTLPMNITLTILADRLLSSSRLYSDIRSGMLPLTTYVEISGVVRLLFKIHVKSTAICDLYINALSRSVVNQTCHYKTKL